MATYLIVDDDREILGIIEAKNMAEAARTLRLPGTDIDIDGYSADIYRVAGKPKRVTLSVETVTKVTIE